ncbi:MAG: YggT family protein [Chloroflexia bacterium]
MSLVFRVSDFLLTLMIFAIIARALLSWFYPVGKDRWSRLLVDATEPILRPIRTVLSSILPIPLDFSPFIAILAIGFLQNMLRSAYVG